MQESLHSAWSGKTVLVTGGRSFLGSHLLPRLTALGAEVIAPPSRILDLRDRPATRLFFSTVRPQIVIHMAAIQGGVAFINERPADIYLDNLLINAHTIDAASASGASRIICIGSSCAYPDGGSRDLTEEDIWDGPMHPSVAHYGITKKAELLHLEACRRQSGLLGSMLVPSSMLGERDDFSPERSHVAGALIRKFVAAVRRGDSTVELWGDGSPVREFMYVGDGVDAILLAGGLAKPPVIMNIGSGEGVSIRELADIIQRLTGFTGQLFWNPSKPNGSPRKVLSSTRAHQALEWRPAVSLEDALARTIQWYCAHHPEAQTHV